MVDEKWADRLDRKLVWFALVMMSLGAVGAWTGYSKLRATIAEELKRELPGLLRSEPELARILKGEKGDKGEQGVPGPPGADFSAVVVSRTVHGRDVEKRNVPERWFPVPQTDTLDMEVPVQIDATSDKYLVSYLYRVSGDHDGFNWSGIEVVDRSGEQVRFFHTDGSYPTSAAMGYSGSCVIDDLAPGMYRVRLLDHSLKAGLRRYTHQRQLSAVKIQ